jgi:uncharacterized phage protein (TIGR02220 family)
MSIIRLKNRAKWVVIDKKPIEDENLSWQAKGILTYLLSKPDDWQVHINQLSGASKNGRDSTRKTIHELVDTGYIVRNQVRNEKGHLVGWEYLVSEEPTGEKVRLERNKPETGKPTSDKPISENPTSENRTLLSNELLSKDKTKVNTTCSRVALDGVCNPSETEEVVPEPVKEITRPEHCADTERGDKVKQQEAIPVGEKKEQEKGASTQCYNIEKREQENAFVAQVINYLNEKADRKFKPDSSNALKYIPPRMKEGYTLIQFKAIIDYKLEEWSDTAKEIRGKPASFYLRPETLFCKENMEKYLEEARHDYKLKYHKKKKEAQKPANQFMTAAQVNALWD